MRTALVNFILFLTAIGCASQPQMVRQSFVKNYRAGEVQTAYVGQSIAKVRDYYAYKNYEVFIIEPTEDFVLTAKIPKKASTYNVMISGSKGKRYEVYYRYKVGNILYNVKYFYDSNGNNSYGVVFDDDGNIQNNILYGSEKVMDFSIQPPDVKLVRSKTIPDNLTCHLGFDYNGRTCGWNNFELVYSGINKNSINLAYKEYSRDDYARTAFYQDLTYEPTAKQIRFKNFIIKIIEATNDKLEYVILSDGLEDRDFLEGSDPAYNRILNR